MRLLVFGGWGQVGSDLATVAAERGHELVRPRRGEVDVEDPAAVGHAVRAADADVVVDLAAFHRTEECERRPDTAFAVNALGALNAARAAHTAGATCVYVSTDYVFDGERAGGYAEHDPVRPVNVYGASKAAGEMLVRSACPRSLVIRGSGMFGHAGSSGKGGNFIETMLASARAGERIEVVDDLTFAPTATRDLADRLLLLLEREAPPGIYHGANRGSCSWFELARTTFELGGVQADLSPRPIARHEVRRPRYSVLLDTRSAALGLPPMRRWEDALRWYLRVRADAQMPAPAGERA